MVQYNNALRTHLILNHKAKGLPGRSFAFRSPKGWGIYDVFKQNKKGTGNPLKNITVQSNSNDLWQPYLLKSA